jgi:hypothetical protein
MRLGGRWGRGREESESVMQGPTCDGLGSVREAVRHVVGLVGN